MRIKRSGIVDALDDPYFKAAVEANWAEGAGPKIMPILGELYAAME